MAFLIGEYECTLDVKQRIRVPAGLVSQLSGDDVGKFVELTHAFIYTP